MYFSVLDCWFTLKSRIAAIFNLTYFQMNMMPIFNSRKLKSLFNKYKLYRLSAKQVYVTNSFFSNLTLFNFKQVCSHACESMLNNVTSVEVYFVVCHIQLIKLKLFDLVACRRSAATVASKYIFNWKHKQGLINIFDASLMNTKRIALKGFVHVLLDFEIIPNYLFFRNSDFDLINFFWLFYCILFLKRSRNNKTN